MMKFLFHLVYKYIFARPNRRLKQIIKLTINIIFSLTCLTFSCVVHYSSIFFIAFAILASTSTIYISVLFFATMTITITIFTITHLLFPQYYRSTYPYLLFSIFAHLQHSTHWFEPSNQMGLHL